MTKSLCLHMHQLTNKQPLYTNNRTGIPISNIPHFNTAKTTVSC